MNIIKLFLTNLRSENTRRTYEDALIEFQQVVKKKNLLDVDIKDILKYKAYLEQKSPATLNNRLSALSSFYDFCNKYIDPKTGKPLLLYNPVSAIKREKVNPYTRSRKMNINEFKLILEQINRKTLRGKRDYAILMFFVYTGRRRSEIVNMNVGDIFEYEGKIFYRYRGKGGKENVRELPQPVVEAVNDYLKSSNRKITKESPLFSALHKETRLSGSAIANMLKKYCRKAGLNPQNYSIHSLRHLGTAIRREAGASVEELQQFLDHSSVATTQIYLEKLTGLEDKQWQNIQKLLKRK